MHDLAAAAEAIQPDVIAIRRGIHSPRTPAALRAENLAIRSSGEPWATFPAATGPETDPSSPLLAVLG